MKYLIAVGILIVVPFVLFSEEDVGPVNSVTVSLCNLGEPVAFGIILTDDQENPLFLEFTLGGNQEVWTEMTFVNPFYFIDKRIDNYRRPSLRLENLFVSSTGTGGA